MQRKTGQVVPAQFEIMRDFMGLAGATHLAHGSKLVDEFKAYTYQLTNTTHFVLGIFIKTILHSVYRYANSALVQRCHRRTAHPLYRLDTSILRCSEAFAIQTTLFTHSFFNLLRGLLFDSLVFVSTLTSTTLNLRHTFSVGHPLTMQSLNAAEPLMRLDARLKDLVGQ